MLWLQACYFYFDKVLLFKQEKLIANIFFRPLLSFLSSFGAILGSQILFDVAKSNLVLAGNFKVQMCDVPQSKVPLITAS